MDIKSLVCGLSLLTAVGSAQALNSPVNIVYPIDGNSYNNYVTASFSTTCPGGTYSVKWGVDSATLGNGTFYDQLSQQFAYKLPTGWHSLWVKSSCGYEVVKFYVN
jgi:hypothetical protein